VCLMSSCFIFRF